MLFNLIHSLVMEIAQAFSGYCNDFASLSISDHFALSISYVHTHHIQRLLIARLSTFKTKLTKQKKPATQKKNECEEIGKVESRLSVSCCLFRATSCIHIAYNGCSTYSHTLLSIKIDNAIVYFRLALSTKIE